MRATTKSKQTARVGLLAGELEKNCTVAAVPAGRSCVMLGDGGVSPLVSLQSHFENGELESVTVRRSNAKADEVLAFIVYEFEVAP